ncbi:hypothetical protein LX32DRAFT_672093 [Colletotrichum zoysiae]|uniref:EGF domain-specific O-linked N-acetylglucosamine transferase n=1 Tax=Colletotrichum zoysiae TaxID=1216348 RepID=A0AAD9HMN4_9PEZI|nr:hypothetical protein LX32DRAFT_672093 [Colletotrichum zoysiae]
MAPKRRHLLSLAGAIFLFLIYPAPERTSGCAVPYRNITSYGYLTGPKYILNEWMSVEKSPITTTSGVASRSSISPRNSYVLLLKREVDGNIWHCMNEIMALMTTFDVLRITRESTAAGTALFSADAVPRTEIVILDDLPDGNYFDLFQMFTQSRPQRLDAWIAGRQVDKKTASIQIRDNIIVPYAGAANSLWSDWKPIECTDNTMLRVFVRRIFDFYGIPRQRQRVDGGRIRVNIIVRKGSRQLMGLDTYLFAAVRDKFASLADVRLVDFEGMPFRAQVELARDTDVLVGMHGAGLTHTMFMEEGRGVLVEIQPDRLCHWGFRNVAKMTGHAYFVAGARKIVGNCYPAPLGGGVEILPDDGKGASYDPSRCYIHTTDTTAWSLGCSDPEETGGDRSFLVCQNRDANDDWYRTCKRKEAADIWWMTRYIMEQDRFVRLVGDAIEAFHQQNRMA